MQPFEFNYQNSDHWAYVRSLLANPQTWWQLRQELRIIAVDDTKDISEDRQWVLQWPDNTGPFVDYCRDCKQFRKWNDDVSFLLVAVERCEEGFWNQSSYPEDVVGWLMDYEIEEADYRYADLRGIGISTILFEDCNFEGANLAKAAMHKTLFGGCNLKDVNMMEGEPFMAGFSGCSMDGLNMQKTDIGWVDFSDVDLSNVNLDQAWCNTFTVWPEGFDRVAAGVKMR